MAIQTINIGNVVNDGLGDNLRSAFQKVNDNFSELQSVLTITASNAAGTSGQGIFKEKIGSDLRFKNLIAGDKIVLEGFTDAIRISSSQQDAFIRIDTDQGAISASDSPYITIQGTDNVSVIADGQVITVDTVLNFNQLVYSLDFGILGFQPTTFQLLAMISNIDFGTIAKPGNIVYDFGTL
jgi:hypothetical protein